MSSFVPIQQACLPPRVRQSPSTPAPAARPLAAIVVAATTTTTTTPSPLSDETKNNPRTGEAAREKPRARRRKTKATQATPPRGDDDEAIPPDTFAWYYRCDDAVTLPTSPGDAPASAHQRVFEFQERLFRVEPTDALGGAVARVACGARTCVVRWCAATLSDADADVYAALRRLASRVTREGDGDDDDGDDADGTLRVTKEELRRLVGVA